MANNNKKAPEAPKAKKAPTKREVDVVLAGHKELRRLGVYTRHEFRIATGRVQPNSPQ